MMNCGKLAGRTLFTGGSIGKEVVLGTNTFFAVMSAKPQPKLQETIPTIAPELGTSEGESLYSMSDQEDQPVADQKLRCSGSLENATTARSALQKNKKNCHLNYSPNAVGSFTRTMMCQNYLKESSSHTLNLNSPPNMKCLWLKNHVSTVLKMAEDFRNDGTVVNTFWTMTSEKNSSPDFFFKEVTNKILLPNTSEQKRMMSTRAENTAGIEKIMTTLNEKFNAEIVNDVQAIFQFNITSGESREIYHIDLRNGSGSAGRGKSEENPDTIFCIDLENFNKLVKGNLEAPNAFMTGRMKISGSMQKAAKLEKLFIKLMEKQSDRVLRERVQSMHN